MTNNLHLVSDSTFFKSIITLFESCAPGENLYWVEVPNDGCKIQNVQHHDKIVPFVSGQVPDKKALGNPQAVFCHYLSSYSMQFIPWITPATRMFWFSWGGDLYPYCWPKERLYKPMTYRFLMEEHALRHSFVFSRVKSLARTIRNRALPHFDLRGQAVKRMDFCSTIVPTEYPIMQTLSGFRARQVRFNYGSIEELVSGLDNQEINGENILVGNSNTATANHVDAFRHIAESVTPIGDVIVPLSYGSGSGRYRNFVIERGKYFFGSRFTPLLNFLPFSDYTRILSTCSTAVFNHIRQQALGNIILLTWLGTNVFINSENPIYQHFKNIGICQHEFSKPFALLPSPTRSEINHARTCLESDYSAAIVQKRVEELLALAGSNN